MPAFFTLSAYKEFKTHHPIYKERCFLAIADKRKRSLQKSNFYLIFLLLCIAGLNIKAQSYTWKSVTMGGGGFVSGILTSKTEQNLMYARTDVGGAYRWNASNSTWIPLLDWTSENETGYNGVESIASDPQAPNKLYMLVGTSYFNSGNTAILRSTDYGNSFAVTNVSGQFKAHGNGMGRQNGEKLVVDPNQGNILFCGTRRNGLFKSTDAGASWSNISSLGTITTPNDNGISFTLIDPASATPGNASQTIFVGISQLGTNLQVSQDGGTTFNPVLGAPASLMPQRAVMGSDRTLYITYGDKEGPWNPGSGAIWKYNTQSLVWTNITPFSNGYSYSGISVDPNNPQRLIASTINKYQLQYGSTYGDRFYLSIDGGSTWRDLVGSSGIVMNNNGCTWVNGHSIHWAGSIEFNPHNTNQAWVTSGNGVFVCEDLSAPTITWKFGARGIDETVPLDMVSVPGGPMFSVIGDYDGFKHTDLTQYAPIHNPQMGTTTGIAYAALSTGKLLRVGSKMYYTIDQGTTWTECALNGTKGKVAISADGNTFLHSPENSTNTYKSINNGSTWTPCNGISINNAVPVADAVNSNKFYAYDNTNGSLYVSTNGGNNFSPASALGMWGSKIIRTLPGQEGHIWAAMYNSGLKRSVNSGSTFTPINNVTTCSAVGFGKAGPSATYLTIYIWGTVNGVSGIHRSMDEGTTWTRINDDAHEYGGPGNGQFVMGDMNIFGRAYMSTVGRGIAYGEDNSVLPVNLTSLNVNASNGFANLSWNSSSEINNSYFEVERSTDGIVFFKAGVVVSKAMNGSSSVPLNYTFTDDIKRLNGIIFYRVKQVDRDNRFVISNTVNIRNDIATVETISVFPNPVIAASFQIKLRLNTNHDIQVRVTDMAGRVVYRLASVKLLAGDNLVNITDMKQLSRGTYLLELISRNSDIIIGRCKIVVQH